jgi:cytochrome c-type biogenesis protein
VATIGQYPANCDAPVNSVSYTAAFVAGVLSITSPCVLPVIPLYVAYLMGSTDRSRTRRGPLMINAAAFVLGFSLVFVLVGTAFGFLGTAMAERKTLLVQLGGLLLIALGLHQIGLIQIPGLRRSVQITSRPPAGGNVLASGLVGMTFAAGWTPCAGPILGAILTLALSRGDAGHAAGLLAVYSAGLAIPFMGIALAGASSSWLSRVAARSESMASVAGAVMLAVGIIMILGIYQQLFARIVSIAPWAPIEPALS